MHTRANGKRRFATAHGDAIDGAAEQPAPP